MCRVILIHVHVQPLYRVAEAADMADLGLGAQEGRKVVKPGQIGHRVDATFLAGIDRIFQNIQAAKLAFIPVGCHPCFKPLIKIA